MLFRHIAAENFHRGNAQAQCEKGLIHRSRNYSAQANLPRPRQIRQQIEAHALSRARQQQAVHRQHHNQPQKAQHHHFGNSLQALLQAKAAHQKAQHYRKKHPTGHLHRAGQQHAKLLAHLFTLQADKLTAGKFVKVAQHPTGNSGVIHHQQITAGNAKPTMPVPFAAGRLQSLIAQHCAFAAGPAHGQLHRQHGHAHNQQKQQIKQHEHTAAVLSRHIGEFPHIANTNGTAGANQQKAQPRLKALSFHNSILTLFNNKIIFSHHKSLI